MALTNTGARRPQSTFTSQIERFVKANEKFHSAIKKDEKDHIKLRALEIGVSEPDKNLANFNALVVAKIVRSEFPHDW